MAGARCEGVLWFVGRVLSMCGLALVYGPRFLRGNGKRGWGRIAGGGGI